MIDEAATIAYVGIGANLGNRLQTMQSAVAMLSEVSEVALNPARDSASLYETSAVGLAQDQPPYLNSAIRLKTALAAREFLLVLGEIEQRLGRSRKDKWESRTIDLDLLLYGDQVIDEPELTVPHPHLHERRFVLEPLAELAPELVHPVLGVSIAELATRLHAERPDQSVVKVGESDWGPPAC